MGSGRSAEHTVLEERRLASLDGLTVDLANMLSSGALACAVSTLRMLLVGPGGVEGCKHQGLQQEISLGL